MPFPLESVGGGSDNEEKNTSNLRFSSIGFVLMAKAGIKKLGRSKRSGPVVDRF